MSSAFIGRREELRLLDHAWKRVCSSGSRHVAVVEAEPGTGKTALIDEFVRRLAPNTLIVRASPISVEAQMSWATLRMLVADWPTDELPHPVAVAVGAVNGDGPPPALADVAFTWAESLRQRADLRPTAVVIDDAQWCDPASAAAIATAIRSSACLWLLGTRPSASIIDVERLVSPADITLLSLGAMRRSDLTELILTTARRTLAPTIVSQIIDLSGGHPLFALELAHEYTHDATAGRPRARSLATMYEDRLAGLSPPAAELTALAALAVHPTLELLARAQPTEDIEAVLSEPERVGLLRIDRQVLVFTHALARHAVIERLGALHQARIHRQLADAIDDPETKAFHLGLATIRPDAEVAAALERAGHVARQRGASSDAADRYERAMLLTPSDQLAERRRRQASAASAASDAGDYERSERLVAELLERPEELDGELLADVAGTAILSADRVVGKRAAETRTRLMISLLVDQPRKRAATWRTLVRIHQFDDLRIAERTAFEAVADAERSGDPADLLAAEAALANVHFLRGDAIDVDGLAARVAEVPSSLAGQSAVSFVQEMATWDDRYELARSLIHAIESEMRRRGDIANLANVLNQASFLEFRAGNVALAEKLAMEVCDLMYPAPGADLFLAAEELLWIAGTRGDEHQVAHLISTTLAEIDLIPPVMQVPFYAYAGYAELALGHHEAAVTLLLGAARTAEAIGMEDARGLGWQVDLAEAQLLSGNLDAAARTIELLGEAARRSRSIVVAVDHLRATGMLQLARGQVGDAVATLTQAVELAPQARRPLVLARTLLACGGALRRAGNRSRARAVLEAARREFSQLEAPIWIERVDDELDRLGNRPSVESASTLTPTERQIAELVTQGRSNRQIAAELIVSLRTVESNLTRVYRKLGVRGRTELAAGGRALLDRVAS